MELVHGNGTIKGRCMDRESSLDGEEGRGKGRGKGGKGEREKEKVREYYHNYTRDSHSQN